MITQLPNLLSIPDIPVWFSILVVAFLVIGSLFVFLGAIGLTFFRNFYDRLHMPALASSLGTICVLIASGTYVSYLAGHIVLKDILIIFFIFITAPISIMMLSRAAAMRDFTQNWSDISDSTFWQLVTDETDAQVQQRVKKEDREEAQQVAAQIRQNARNAAKKGRLPKKYPKTEDKKSHSKPAGSKKNTVSKTKAHSSKTKVETEKKSAVKKNGSTKKTATKKAETKKPVTKKLAAKKPTVQRKSQQKTTKTTKSNTKSHKTKTEV